MSNGSWNGFWRRLGKDRAFRLWMFAKFLDAVGIVAVVVMFVATGVNAFSTLSTLDLAAVKAGDAVEILKTLVWSNGLLTGVTMALIIWILCMVFARSFETESLRLRVNKIEDHSLLWDDMTAYFGGDYVQSFAEIGEASEDDTRKESPAVAKWRHRAALTTFPRFPQKETFYPKKEAEEKT